MIVSPKRKEKKTARMRMCFLLRKEVTTESKDEAKTWIYGNNNLS